jgi:hypothetical protein
MIAPEFEQPSNGFARTIALKLSSESTLFRSPELRGPNSNCPAKAHETNVALKRCGVRSWPRAASMMIVSVGLVFLVSCVGSPAARHVDEPSSPIPLQITAGPWPVGALHAQYETQVSVTGGVPPYSWIVVEGELPPGLSLGPSTGVIGGRSSEAGSFSFRVQIDDARADTVSGGLSINISTEQAPAIATVSPNSGATEGDTRVTIRGTNFRAGASVSFAHSPGTSVLVSNSNEIEATTPAGTPGSVSVTVQNVDGELATDANSFLFGDAAKSNGPALPTLPQALVDSSYPDTTGYTVTAVTPGTLQTALKNASCAPNGTILELPRGSVDKEAITLPYKACAAGKWIIITTADVSLPAQGTRIDPSGFVGQIARITDSVSGGSTVQTERNNPVNHYRLVGLEIEQTAPIVYMAIDIGAYATASDQLPSNIIIDRCYVHGKASNNVQRDILLNGSDLAVVDSYVSEAHWAGEDAQAVGTWNGSGPLKITNNFLEGSGENILIGGAVALPNLIPSDIEIRSNYFYKPLSWRKSDPSYAGIPWTIKNLFELKNAQRVIVEGNVLENNWAMAQTGTAILFTPRAEYGKMSWDVVQDVTVSHNIVRHAAGAFNMLGIDNNDKTTVGVVRLHRILVRDNLLQDISKTNWLGYGVLFELLWGPENITIDHNTGFSDYGFGLVDGSPSSNLLFTNNIVERGKVGLIGSGTAEGNASITKFAPSAVFSHNAIVGGSPSLYPPGNLFPTSIPDLHFVNYGGEGTGDYALCTGKNVPSLSCVAASPVAMGQPKACQNNTDCGADISGVSNLTAGVAVVPANLPSMNSLSPGAMVCNGVNSLTIEGANLNLQGVEVLVNGQLVVPSNVAADALTITPPAASGVTVPVALDDFGLSTTKALVCQ